MFAGVKTGAVLVAHPDDETLWAGGTILAHPEIGWTIMTLTRKFDTDRSSKFFKAAGLFGAKGFDQALEIQTRTVDVHITTLRKKLKNESKRIVTVKNYGYRFELDSDED